MWEERALSAPSVPSWDDRFEGGEVAVIAEIKRRSPSAGAIAEALDPISHASAYVRGGAKAISVLTEPDYFGGTLDELVAIRHAVGVPVLRKDFILDPVQVLEARAAGASAVLLIVRILDAPRLTDLVVLARELNLGVLVEVHTAEELDAALAGGAPVVGVNSRDLDRFEVDLEAIAPILAAVPPDVIAVAESGLRTRGDVERVAAWGADAVLVGTHVAGHPDPSSAVQELTGIRRSGRTGAGGDR